MMLPEGWTLCTLIGILDKTVTPPLSARIALDAGEFEQKKGYVLRSREMGCTSSVVGSKWVSVNRTRVGRKISIAEEIRFNLEEVELLLFTFFKPQVFHNERVKEFLISLLLAVLERRGEWRMEGMEGSSASRAFVGMVGFDIN